MRRAIWWRKRARSVPYGAIVLESIGMDEVYTYAPEGWRFVFIYDDTKPTDRIFVGKMVHLWKLVRL